MSATHDHVDDEDTHDAAAMADQLLIAVLESQLRDDLDDDTDDALETDSHPTHCQIIAEVQGIKIDDDDDEDVDVDDKENVSRKWNAQLEIPIPPEIVSDVKEQAKERAMESESEGVSSSSWRYSAHTERVGSAVSSYPMHQDHLSMCTTLPQSLSRPRSQPPPPTTAANTATAAMKTEDTSTLSTISSHSTISPPPPNTVPTVMMPMPPMPMSMPLAMSYQPYQAYQPCHAAAPAHSPMFTLHAHPLAMHNPLPPTTMAPPSPVSTPSTDVTGRTSSNGKSGRSSCSGEHTSTVQVQFSEMALFAFLLRTVESLVSLAWTPQSQDDLVATLCSYIRSRLPAVSAWEWQQMVSHLATVYVPEMVAMITHHPLRVMATLGQSGQGVPRQGVQGLQGGRSSSSRCQCFRQIAMETLQGIKQQIIRYQLHLQPVQTAVQTNPGETGSTAGDLNFRTLTKMTTSDSISTAAPRLSGTEKATRDSHRDSWEGPRLCSEASAMTASHAQTLVAGSIAVSQCKRAAQGQCFESVHFKEEQQGNVKAKPIIAANG